MKKEDKKQSRKKGEAGYWERDTDAAHAAAAKESAVFETAEDFTRTANGYFDDCDEAGMLYSEAGLCLWLGAHNPKGRSVTLGTLRKWYDGETCKYLQGAVQLAYLRIQEQIETDPRYQDKGGMATKAIFLLKQTRFGGFTDKPEQQSSTTVNISFGKTMDSSDFA